MTNFDENTEGRDFFVGDIHGMYSLFFDVLASVDFDFDTDRVFAVGDLIDRGPESLKCLTLITKDWFFSVRGNHEELMLGSHGYSVWMMNGGNWSNSVEHEDLVLWCELIRKHMPYTMTVNTSKGVIGVVHAESTPDWNDNPSEELNTWARHLIRKQTAITTNIDRVVCGHTPLKKVVRFTNHVYIDTGACFVTDNGFLTMLSVDEVFKNEI